MSFLKKSLEKRLKKIFEETQNKFFVYDNRVPQWGSSFNISGPETVDGVPVYSVTGFRNHIPSEGDRVASGLSKGTLGLFMLFDVKRPGDPSDMFFAQAILTDNDYKAGFGFGKGGKELQEDSFTGALAAQLSPLSAKHNAAAVKPPEKTTPETTQAEMLDVVHQMQRRLSQTP